MKIKGREGRREVQVQVEGGGGAGHSGRGGGGRQESGGKVQGGRGRGVVEGGRARRLCPSKTPGEIITKHLPTMSAFRYC